MAQAEVVEKEALGSRNRESWLLPLGVMVALALLCEAMLALSYFLLEYRRCVPWEPLHEVDFGDPRNLFFFMGLTRLFFLLSAADAALLAVGGGLMIAMGFAKEGLGRRAAFACFAPSIGLAVFCSLLACRGLAELWINGKWSF